MDATSAAPKQPHGLPATAFVAEYTAKAPKRKIAATHVGRGQRFKSRHAPRISSTSTIAITAHFEERTPV
jgi:hypothetical protein